MHKSEWGKACTGTHYILCTPEGNYEWGSAMQGNWLGGQGNARREKVATWVHRSRSLELQKRRPGGPFLHWTNPSEPFLYWHVGSLRSPPKNTHVVTRPFLRETGVSRTMCALRFKVLIKLLGMKVSGRRASTNSWQNCRISRVRLRVST